MALGNPHMDVLWLQSGGCGGCTMSLLCSHSRDLFGTQEGCGVRFLWHPGISEETGTAVTRLLERLASGAQALDVLCLEGAVLRGPHGSGRFHRYAGSDTPMFEWVRRLAVLARYTVAVGSCAAYGGLVSAGSNPTDACGLQYESDM